jgi:hypothetical protein
MAKELCVACGKETPYDFETNIEHRMGYLEGMGQLCLSCFESKIDEDIICIPKSLIIDTSNDMDLGRKVRDIINKR